MVSEKRKAYQREWIRRKRAKQKLSENARAIVEVPEEPKITSIPEGCTPIGVPDFSVCMHCRSKHISRNGTLVHCRACGITYDLSVGFVQDVWGEESI